MYALLALSATVLTSFLPIFNKRILRDARPAFVAWAINGFSLPILAIGTLLLTQCRPTPLRNAVPFSCTTQLPQLDSMFVIALLASVVLNWGATLLSTSALAKADASLVSPLLAFNPVFTLLVAWFSLGETTGLRQTMGVVVVLLGAYLLEVAEARTGLLSPLRVLLCRPGAVLAVIASAMWGTTTVFEKLAIEHMTPPSGPFVALTGTVLMVALLTPNAFFSRGKTDIPEHKRGLSGLCAHPRALEQRIHDPVLLTALQTVTILLLGIVFLMTNKPSLIVSLIVMAVALALGVASSLLVSRATRTREQSVATPVDRMREPVR